MLSNGTILYYQKSSYYGILILQSDNHQWTKILPQYGWDGLKFKKMRHKTNKKVVYSCVRLFIHVIVSIRISQHIQATAKVNILHTTTHTTTARTSPAATSHPLPSPRRYPISTQIIPLYRPITAQNPTQVSAMVRNQEDA